MATFVCVHGAFHGPWCWEELARRLAPLGHACRAVALPGVGDDPEAVTGATLEACVAAVAQTVEAEAGRVWLVGHSMGGVTVAQAAEALAERLEGVVYVTAIAPADGQSGAEAVGAPEPDADTTTITVDVAHGAARLDVDRAAALFYPLCAERHVARAKARLRTWQALAPALTPLRLSPARAGRVPACYVECLQDRVIGLETQRRLQRNAGVRAVRTLDADHSPFFSRPAELAEALAAFAGGG